MSQPMPNYSTSEDQQDPAKATVAISRDRKTPLPCRYINKRIPRQKGRVCAIPVRRYLGAERVCTPRACVEAGGCAG